MGVQTALDAVLQTPSIVDAMHLADDLAFEAGRDPGVRTLRVLNTAIRGTDEVAAIAAVHALAEIYDEQAARMLCALLSDSRATIREHATWALSSSLPRIEAMGRLIASVAEGGFGGMLAQRTLEVWSNDARDALSVGLEAALLGITAPASRARLIETLGLVRGEVATRPLLLIAQDKSESLAARRAAIEALGQRTAQSGMLVPALEEILLEGDRIGAAARIALLDLEPTPHHSARDSTGDSTAMTVAQMFLHADIDPTLASAGAGDNGGIATLLVRLGDALVTDSTVGVQRVLTLSRGPVAQATSDLLDIGASDSGHMYARVPLADEPMPSAAAWPLRVTIRRGIRRVLRAAGHVDLLHLRMADVGSLAAADVARELGIPVVFTVAPDPHAVIRSLDLSGDLTRIDFGETDLREHFWFRTRLVQRLSSNAAHTVLFPRPELQRDMQQLVGIDITSHPERHTIVAEGVDLVVTEDSVAEARAHAEGAEATPSLIALRELLQGLPAARRSLPLIVSLGRLHRVKGMATLVETWAQSDLRERANLVIIGGDLETPSLDEREQLDRIDAVVPPTDRVNHGLLLAGHQPNNIAARWLAAARFGLPGFAAPNGAYVCASVKEEFGIALLEAMATGLTVVAPDGGGPATYVEQGRTGILTETWNREMLQRAVGAALDLAVLPGTERADAAHDMVSDNFTIQAMASALGPVYRHVVADEAELVREARGVL
ncbi:glycosyltransferase involved in cell wall biosynthesis [Microbacterium endophyticum]|uniref:D-inositol 3-phosphate glycosyltransferase n=1 Tax=Microbacterium endophyticum TaxID=1526412 RepID=A0A7W4YM99_9MICO|nr:glycosyltransferase [Microbacterium endophyticum]MBB2976255.1 glycosyltransferase involved in cell wall biosynthesis [Microbacterium endophyticum]NIK35135.1 glycosyltransferase involved in cell wall biosynthesis [Microbacterium endophyticum]